MVGKYYILGGGVSGLVLAYELLKKGCEVVIIERDNCVGGLAKSFKWHDREVDQGPHIYHTPDSDIVNYWKSEFDNLFFEREHWSKNLKEGVYYDYPISKESIEKLPINLRDRIIQDLATRNPDDLPKAKNYYEYIKALAGETLQEIFFIKYPEKVWGMSTKELDANWAPKRIEIRDKATPFYWGQWSAVGKESCGTIIESLRSKVTGLQGDIYTDEKILALKYDNQRINTIITDQRSIRLNRNDIVINTTSYTQIASFFDKKTALKYRGIYLVFLAIRRVDILPEGVDFIYIDDPGICFNRVSDQNSFVKYPSHDDTVICCEITFSDGDELDIMDNDQIIEKTIKDFVSLNLCQRDEIDNSKILKLHEVYPMFFIGYQKALAEMNAFLDRISNLYLLGSNAEYAYTDLQVLFSKAIDLAEVLTNDTFKINKIIKSKPALRFNDVIQIDGKDIGKDNKPYLIAEIGLNHNGDINMAKKLIDKAVENGADAVKFQSYKSGKRVAKEGKTSRYVEKILGIEETDFQMLKKNELSISQMKDLIDYAKNRITLFSAPFDLESLRELEAFDLPCYKIASFDIVNLPLIRDIAMTGKPIILSTGMSNLSEIEDALSVIAETGNFNVALLHCTSSYPAPPETMNIRAIDTMRSAFNLPVGISDHVIGDYVSLAAVARGANIVEKHFTLDKRMEGPDHILSLEPDELKDLSLKIDNIGKALGTGIKQISPNEMSTLVRFRKTMYSCRELKKGSKIKKDDIVYKGPAYGIYAKYEEIVLGRKLMRAIDSDTPITWDLFE